MNSTGGIFGDCAQQHFEMSGHALDRCFFEQVGIVLYFRYQMIAFGRESERQIEFCEGSGAPRSGAFCFAKARA